MRVTTQMLNASAKRAGISLGGTSLLNYINGSNTQSTQNALLNAMSHTQTAKVNKTQCENYETLEEAADTLENRLQTFLQEGEESVFQKAEEDKNVLTDAVKQMVDAYNRTVKAIKNTSNPLNDFYQEMLEEAASEKEADLAEIGITQDKNGTLSLDSEKLKSADIETIKKALDGKGTFSAKAAFIASRVSDNAKANAQSYSSQYGADGYCYGTNVSKYDFWG